LDDTDLKDEMKSWVVAEARERLHQHQQRFEQRTLAECIAEVIITYNPSGTG